MDCSPRYHRMGVMLLVHCKIVRFLLTVKTLNILSCFSHLKVFWQSMTEKKNDILNYLVLTTPYLFKATQLGPPMEKQSSSQGPRPNISTKVESITVRLPNNRIRPVIKNSKKVT